MEDKSEVVYRTLDSGVAAEDVQKNKNFIKYGSEDDYAGAEKLLEEEWRYLEDHREDFDRNNIKGIALSGGGIRSASFCLGVMQALAGKSKLGQFDYLSTVSGGGYLGGALSWLWSDLWKDAGSSSSSFGVDPLDFPFGTEGRRFKFDDSKHKAANRNQASLLRHLRQNGKYLTPGGGITVFSFVSIILRSVVMGFVTVMAFSCLLFSLFYTFGLFEPKTAFGWVGVNDLLENVLWLALATYVFLHSCYMYLIAKNKKDHLSDAAYSRRRWFQQWLSSSLKAGLAVGVLVAAHLIQIGLGDTVVETGGIAAVLGAVLGSMGAESKWRKLFSAIPDNVQKIVAAALVIFGVLVLSDSLVSYLIADSDDFWVTVGFGLSAWCVYKLADKLPINNISIHRYYRDRLMETFMPDVEKVIVSPKDDKARKASKANRKGLHELADVSNQNTKAPYHLINTNAILVESNIAKFRGRGGDNFILSPLYCGSNATGWRKTEEFCGGKITLPTAVAISGAAANPNAGVAGQGLTTNPIISILMSLFNLRLGYWVTNPDPARMVDTGKVPSYADPGFWEIYARNKMNQDAQFVQLSDGGHFENLGLYELFRRRARLIIVCDAGADKDYEFGDLANAIEKARVDFGLDVDLDKTKLQALVPTAASAQSELDYPVANAAYLLAEVDYHDQHRKKSWLVYIKTTLTQDISADVHGYKRVNPDFPDQTTADQFFDEVQFEAYRSLGQQIAEKILADEEIAELV